MVLLPLPEHRKRRVLVCTTIRKPLPVLRAYLDSLDAQLWPADVKAEFAFVPDFSADQEDARQYLFKWLGERGGTLIEGIPATQQDFSDASGQPTHVWTNTSMARVGANKNRLIEFALNAKHDAVWLIDADLICEPSTFLSLDSCELPIVTAVYWTRWQKQRSEVQPMPFMPQVWLQHPYQLAGRGMDEGEFRAKLLDRGLHRVWGFGACTLIQRKVLEAGVNYEYLADVPKEGMMAGEDRHFCIRAERLHIPAYADCWPDIFHIYHAPTDIERIPDMVARLGDRRGGRAALGDLVALRLRPLEPVPVAPGQLRQPMPQLVRGRLGQLALLPEIEETVYELNVGEKRTIRAHFPLHYPIPYLRGRTRLIEVALLDAKPFGFPPNVEEELFVKPKSGAMTDPITLTPQQQEMARV